LPAIGIARCNISEALRQAGGAKAADARDAPFARQRWQFDTPADPAVRTAEKFAAAVRATRLRLIDIDISHAAA